MTSRRVTKSRNSDEALNRLEARPGNQESPVRLADGPGTSSRKSTAGPLPQTRDRQTESSASAPTHAPHSPRQSSAELVDGLDPKSERELDKVMKDVDGLLTKGKWQVYIHLRKQLGHGDRATVLTQIYYWMGRSKKSNQRRAKARFGGRRFVAKTHEELAGELGMQKRQVKSCLTWLRRNGWVRIERHKFGKKGQRHHASYIRPLRAPDVPSV